MELEATTLPTKLQPLPERKQYFPYSNFLSLGQTKLSSESGVLLQFTNRWTDHLQMFLVRIPIDNDNVRKVFLTIIEQP